MSLEMMAWADSQTVGDPLAKFVLLHLGDDADDQNDARLSIESLCRRTEMSPAMVERKLVYLEARGFLRRRVGPSPATSIEGPIYRLAPTLEPADPLQGMLL
jgi:DNA-binding HxlR family transcriptional regulator